MSTSKDISGHKMCPLGVKLISSIRKFHFSSSAEAEPLPNKSANSVALFLYKMFCRYAPIVKKMFVLIF